MPWEGAVSPFGFGSADNPWLPMPAEFAELTVESQLADCDSTLSLYQDALQLRRKLADLHESDFSWQQAPKGCLAFRRGPNLVVVLNAGDQPVDLPDGEVLLASSAIDNRQLPANTAVWLQV